MLIKRKVVNSMKVNVVMFIDNLCLHHEYVNYLHFIPSDHMLKSKTKKWCMIWDSHNYVTKIQ